LSTHRPHLAALANKFVEWRAMNAPTKSQQIMIDDGLPLAAALTHEERLETWKGRRLTRTAPPIERPKAEDPEARKLRKEVEAAEAKKKAEKLRLLRENQQLARDEARAVKEAAEAAQATTQETDVKKASTLSKIIPTPTRGKGNSAKKKSKTKAARRAPTAARTKPPAKPKADPKPRDGRVSAQQVADFVSRAGGASMEELVAEFGIEAHPMRAKIFYVRHTLGYDVEVKEGRYLGTAPKVSK
jgi:hypothetical protein